MSDKKLLMEEILEEVGRKPLEKIEIPKYITENLKHQLWDWQIKALQYFIAYEDEEYDFERDRNMPYHLMFNMATGTGKTLLMASLILYYYKKGYRNFIFFVNQNNIVDKTENNLINKNHIKYLFKNNIIIDDRIVNIKKVDTFSQDTDNIEIIFTTIHNLHNSVYIEKENQTTLKDLQKRDLIMLGDEAHHLNSETKKNGEKLLFEKELSDNSSETDIERTWENTVLYKLLRKEESKATENRNVLLEFTATIPNHKNVEEKYISKIIYKFGLKDFLNAKYTKEINLISSKFNDNEKADKNIRILQALLFNWYRERIATDNKIFPFKPVILFRSKTIEESENDYRDFLKLIENLNSDNFNFLGEIDRAVLEEKQSYQRGKSITKKVINYIQTNNIKYQEIIKFLQDKFKEKNCIITNSKDKTAKGKRGGEKTTAEQETLLNSLEDINNHVRAIFTVQRLTEGWDTLNLYDIVRLYQGRDEGKEVSTGKRKAGATTTSEVQLIGRGVRYYPFEYNNMIKNKRKFDNDLNNDLRALEELYYHSDSDHRYLDELKRELKNEGYIDDNKIVKEFDLKDEFKKSNFYKKIKLFKNERIENPERKKKTLSDIIKEIEVRKEIKSIYTREEHLILEENSKDDVLLQSKNEDSKSIKITVKQMIDKYYEKHILLKAINNLSRQENSFYQFKKITEEIDIKSIEEFFNEEFIGSLSIEYIVNEDIIEKLKKESQNDYVTDEEIYLSIDNQIKLYVIMGMLEKVSIKIKEYSNPYKGTDFKEFSFRVL